MAEENEKPTPVGKSESDEGEAKVSKEEGPAPSPAAGSTGVMSFDDALELTGRGRFSYEVLVASCLIFNYSIIEMVAIGYIITPAECDLNLTVGQKSMVNSALYIGIIATSIAWGEVSDRYGRRKIMLPCLIGCVVTSFFSSLALSFWPMFIFRTLTGFMISAPSATVLVYLGELQTSAFRDISIGIAVTSAQVMFVFLPGIAWLLVPNSWSFKLGVLIRPWRVFMWTWGLVGLAAAGLLFRLPESPSFLMIRKGPEAALPVLASIFAGNHKVSGERLPATGLLEIHEHKTNIKNDLLQLMKPPMLKCYLLTHGCMFITFALSNGLYFWLPDFINEALKHVGAPYSMCKLINLKYLNTEEDLESPDQIPKMMRFFISQEQEMSDDCDAGEVNKFMYPMSMVMEIITLVPFVLVNVYIHKIKKSLIFGVIMLVNSVALILAAVIPQMGVAVIFLIIGLAAGGACSILSALAVDAFPTSLRSVAMCTMYTAGHLGAIIGTSLVGLMYDFWCHILFILSACIASGSAVALYLLWPDLKVVRTEMEAREFTY